MKSLPLRWRIIAALIGLALGTTLALTLLARYFLALSLQTSVNVEMGSALTSALALAKENYDSKKRQLQDVGHLLSAPPHRDRDALHAAFANAGLEDLTLRIVPVEQVETDLTHGPVVSKVADDQLRLVLVLPDSQRALIALHSLAALTEVKNAVHTYKHIEMAEGELRTAFLLAFLVAAAGVVILACVIGIRIGFGITRPLHALLKGTREMARDNLQYRIPNNRDDEIGVLIESFNQMAQDLVENRRKRVEAEQIAAWREIARAVGARNQKSPDAHSTRGATDARQVRGRRPGVSALCDRLHGNRHRRSHDAALFGRGICQFRAHALSVARAERSQQERAPRRSPVPGRTHSPRLGGRPTPARTRLGADAPRVDQFDRKRH